MKIRLSHLCFFAMLLLCPVLQAGEEDLLTLKDREVVLGVKAELGGRVMLFRRTDGENVIHSDEAHWRLKDDEIPPRDAKSPSVEYMGHIVWVGPQSKWWQDADGDLKPLTSGYHCDPYLIYDRCKVLEHSSEKLVLMGNTSPLNGMRMKKEFELLDNARVKITVTVTNMRNRPVTWNIWSNTRFKPVGKCGFFVTEKSNLNLSFVGWRPWKERSLMFSVDKSMCSFMEPPAEAVKQFTFMGKLAYRQYCPIYAVYGNSLFMKEVLGNPNMWKTPSGHYPLEVYQRYANGPRGNVMELEFHSPQFTLQPGQSESFAELWTLRQIKDADKRKPLHAIIGKYTKQKENKK